MVYSKLADLIVMICGSGIMDELVLLEVHSALVGVLKLLIPKGYVQHVSFHPIFSGNFNVETPFRARCDCSDLLSCVHVTTSPCMLQYLRICMYAAHEPGFSVYLCSCMDLYMHAYSCVHMVLFACACTRFLSILTR